MVCKGSSRPARATERDLGSKQTDKQTNKQKEGVNKGDRAKLESAKEASGSRTRSHYD